MLCWSSASQPAGDCGSRCLCWSSTSELSGEIAAVILSSASQLSGEIAAFIVRLRVPLSGEIVAIVVCVQVPVPGRTLTIGRWNSRRTITVVISLKVAGASNMKVRAPSIWGQPSTWSRSCSPTPIPAFGINFAVSMCGFHVGKACGVGACAVLGGRVLTHVAEAVVHAWFANSIRHWFINIAKPISPTLLDPIFSTLAGSISSTLVSFISSTFANSVSSTPDLKSNPPTLGVRSRQHSKVLSLRD